jgi:demethylmenaquinone methyltransferase/2-methoxy-6-polyprenyl-1,4-benzoquinol methylase
VSVAGPDERAVAEVVPTGVPGRTKAERVRAMFARIVPRYDLMNALMSLGMDHRWRRAAARAAEPAGRIALDVGTGTGDLAFALADAGSKRVVGVDFCEEMLAAARSKAGRVGVAGVTFIAGDALALPFPDGTFDCVVSGFVLRNVADLRAALDEMVRVLKPGGSFVCLEITHPPRLLAPFFSVYFGWFVPLLGAVVGHDRAAYRYLPRSLGPLPTAERLAAMLTETGLTAVRVRRLGLGTVALHIGRRPAAVPTR